ncbi:NADPH-dependent FMN reductase [Natronincola peptidivorans]|uniref:NADPH-dependent FMN reductase n=1 Tax=Natronincola peptidivorans TaxID=426128 RepID=A0A1I0CC12_9FIRM|nr:flavodoxin family protein [Natronincola peptidivorans]SET16948.1 NADPH-dependent FMN reductase [Natronincola peptidivorans]
MSVVVLDGMSEKNCIEEKLRLILDEEVDSVSYFNLKDMNIMPCRCCETCNYKTPGRCIIKDDMTEVLKAIARCNMLVWVTPITFGGYSSQLKKAMDRLVVMGLPLFFVKDGHLLHPMRYYKTSLLGIGWIENHSQTQEENFKTLVERNALNMQSPHKSLVFTSADEIKTIENEISNAVKEVYPLCLKRDYSL